MDFLDGPGATRRVLPTVTVLMAAYNYARFIERALNSVLDQDYPAELLDVIVIDDESTDETPEILERYAAAYPDRVTVIRQANAGNRVAANTAFPRARGELIAMMDADDMWPLDKIGRQVALMLSNERLGLVYCDTEVIDADDQIVHPSYWELYDIVPQRGPEAYLEIMSYPGNIALNSTILFRKELGAAFFPMPEQNIFQDWWITGHCALVSEIDYVEGLRSGYRQHGANALLGAQRHRQSIGRCKTAEMRRKMLVHGAGDRLTDAQLIDAWQAWEHTLRDLAWSRQTLYLPVTPSTDEELAWGAEHHAAATAAIAAGDASGALRAAIRALACDPFNGPYRDLVEDLRWVNEAFRGVSGEAFGDPARRFLTLAYADELVLEPELLSRYVAVVGEDDRATLAIAAPGLGPDLARSTVMSAADGAGVDFNALPDVVLVTDDTPAAQVQLERSANALLSHRDIGLELPVFRPESFAALRALSLT